MRKFLKSLISRFFQIGLDPNDNEEVRLEKTLLVVGSFMIIPASTIWGAIFVLFGEPLAGSISLFYSVVTLVSLVVFGVTRHHRLILRSQLLMGLILPPLQMIALGGFNNSGAVILWSLISPLGVLLFYGARRTLRWWFAYFVIVVFSGLAQPLLRTANNLPSGLVIAFFVLNITAVSSIVFVTLNYFLQQKNEAYRRLRIEEEKAENLLLNILPKEIAAILKNENRTIADQFDGASILFADLVGFTSLTAQMAPVEMVELLNEIFSHFDSLVEKYDLEKIRTIGDNYMVASGVPRPRPDHAQAIAHLALDMLDYIRNFPLQNGRRIEFRIGINSGPVIGGVIGRKKFVYDLWSDAVNIASRMESQGQAGKIQITRATHDMIQSRFICESRGTLPVKGRGEMETWFLVGVRTE